MFITSKVYGTNLVITNFHTTYREWRFEMGKSKQWRLRTTCYKLEFKWKAHVFFKYLYILLTRIF